MIGSSQTGQNPFLQQFTCEPGSMLGYFTERGSDRQQVVACYDRLLRPKKEKIDCIRMIDNVHEQTTACPPHQPDWKKQILIQISQPFAECRLTPGEYGKERLGPGHQNFDPAGSKAPLDQFCSSQHALLPVQAIIANQ